MDNIQFKIRGVNRLLSLAELQKISKKKRVGVVQVVDIRSQRNYKTSYLKILEKFG